jgi:hypothetical protein
MSTVPLRKRRGFYCFNFSLAGGASLVTLMREPRKIFLTDNALVGFDRSFNRVLQFRNLFGEILPRQRERIVELIVRKSFALEPTEHQLTLSSTASLPK